MMYKGLHTVDVDDRIRKFISAYDVLLNLADLTEVVRYELIVNNAYLSCCMVYRQLKLVIMRCIDCI